MSKCVIHYKPSDLQVMHFNTHAPDDEVAGEYASNNSYTFAIITGEALLDKVKEMGRECKVVLTDGVITDLVASTNPIQPAESEEVDLEVEIATLKARIEVLEGG